VRRVRSPCHSATRLNNDADAGASQDPEYGKGRKPLPHCNRAEDHANTSKQLRSRLRDSMVAGSQADEFAIEHRAPQGENVNRRHRQQPQGYAGERAKTSAHSMADKKCNRDREHHEVVVGNVRRREQAAGRQRRGLEFEYGIALPRPSRPRSRAGSGCSRAHAPRSATRRIAAVPQRALPEISHFVAEFYECCADPKSPPLTFSKFGRFGSSFLRCRVARLRVRRSQKESRGSVATPAVFTTFARR
jgi:hypothetical protein